MLHIISNLTSVVSTTVYPERTARDTDTGWVLGKGRTARMTVIIIAVIDHIILGYHIQCNQQGHYEES